MPEPVEGTEELEAQIETEVDETDVVQEDSTNASLDDVEDPEALKKLVRKLRRENASARVKNKELDEFRAWKESQLSEAEKLQARLDAAEQRAQAAEKKAIVKEFGIPDELADFISGSSEEMQSKAELLAEKLKTPRRVVPEDRAPVRKRSEVDDGGEFLKMLALRDLGM